MFLTVSIEDILKRIYAESALRFAAARISEKPSILIRDHEKALRRLIIDQFYEIVGMLAPAVIDFGPQPTPDDSEILYLELSGREDPAAAVTLTAAVTGRLSYAIYCDSPGSASAVGLAAAENALSRLRSLTRSSPRCTRLKPGL